MKHVTILFFGLLAAGACASEVGSEATGSAAGGGGQGGAFNAVGGASGVGGRGDGGPCVPAADHSSDSHNCGACGHDCLGGDCVESACQPVAIWSGDALSPLFVDDTYLYWARIKTMGEHHCAALTLVRAPKSSGPLAAAPEAVLDEGVGDFGVRGGTIYYGTSRCNEFDRAIRSFPADFAGTPVTTTLGTWSYEGFGLAVGANAAFVITGTSATGATALVSVPLAGGPSTTLVPDLGDVVGLLTDDVGLYWPVGPTLDILSMPVSGGSPSTIVSSADLGFDGVALGLVDGLAVYYAAWVGQVNTLRKLGISETGAGEVLYPAGAGFVQTLPGLPGSVGVVSSGDDICFSVTATSESVVCVPKAGGASREIVPGVSGMVIETLAADDTAVYWIESPGDLTSTVYRVAK